MLCKKDNTSVVREENCYFHQTRMEYLLKRIHSNSNHKDVIRTVVISLLQDFIYLMPGKIRNGEWFEYELNEIIEPLFHALESFHELVYVDTLSNQNITTKYILEMADLVVVNLNQNPIVLKDFFENYEALREKAIYLIGNYTKYSQYNLKNIQKKYKIPQGKIAVIPYNIEYKEALADGNIISFLTRNYKCNPGDYNYYFIQELKNAVIMIDEHTRRKHQNGIFH